MKYITMFATALLFFVTPLSAQQGMHHSSGQMMSQDTVRGMTGQRGYHIE